MKKRLREFFESIAYAGLKPAGQKAEAPKPGRLGWLKSRIDRLLSGPTPTDPLYLTNRTFSQKARTWVMIGVPCLILVAGIGVALSNILEPPEPKPIKKPSAQEISARILPNFNNDLKLQRNTEVEVAEIIIEPTGRPRLTGAVRNTTDHDIAKANVVIDLTDTNGSQVGGVEVHIEGIPAAKTKSFSVPIMQRTAAFALVRDITTGK